jgi:2-polyprenyl-3-methyl-5-hydroxy-6-metoxy-1,4-benzoquinol methylase
MATATTQQPSPSLFFETINAYQRSAALKAAIDLGIFTAIAEGARTAGEIAKQVKAAERGVRIVCDYLTILGFLSKNAGRYGLTADSSFFLTRQSPAYVGDAIKFLLNPYQTDHFKDFTETVRHGGALGEATIAPENPIWVEFARSMAPLIAPAAHGIAEALKEDLSGSNPKKILDIAAGHGMFGITMANQFPNVSVVALDWSNVLQVAKENAAKAGLGRRHSTIAGSAFDADFGTGYDAVLVTNFLHHFDIPTCEKLLKKTYAALKPGGAVAVLEFVPNDDRVSPALPAAFSIIMLANTPAGDAYTYTELAAMLKNGGYGNVKRHPMPALPQEVITAEKL